ncbi:MAG TPA: 4Fe-4S binding protein, partial [Anaerolineales bacterium]|nr:4Fe-4S binding protein [Anaerolineales bacterium]
NFREVDLTLTEAEVLQEAGRCLRCANCSECLECQAACPRGAIDHEMHPSHQSVDAGAIIWAEGTLPTMEIKEGQSCFCVPADSALLGSMAAAHTLSVLIDGRRARSTPQSQKSVATTGRTGVFICQCGGTISKVIDTQEVSQQAAELPNVVYVQELPFSCSPDASQAICAAMETYQLNQLVLAGCTCCPMDQVCYSCTYQRVRTKSNLGLFAPLEGGAFRTAQSARLEFVNIREQCALVHANNHQAATAKASALVAAAVARVQAAPVNLVGVPSIDRTAIILGSGSAGPACRQLLESHGVSVQMLRDIPTQVQRAGGQYIVRIDNQQSETATHQASALVLSPRDSEEAEQISIAFGRERRRPTVHPAWGGLETHRPGVFHCDPSGDAEIIGAAVAARLSAWLGRMESRSPIAAVVDPERCRACKTCVDACEYGAPGLVNVNGRYTSWIDPAICTGCGTCAAQCPSGAISAGCSTDLQINAMLGAILGL